MNKKLLAIVIAGAMVIPIAAHAEKLGLGFVSVSSHVHSANCAHAGNAPNISALDIRLASLDLFVSDKSPGDIFLDQPVGGEPGGDISTAHATSEGTGKPCANCKNPETTFPITEVGWQTLH